MRLRMDVRSESSKTYFQITSANITSQTHVKQINIWREPCNAVFVACIVSPKIHKAATALSVPASTIERGDNEHIRQAIQISNNTSMTTRMDHAVAAPTIPSWWIIHHSKTPYRANSIRKSFAVASGRPSACKKQYGTCAKQLTKTPTAKIRNTMPLYSANSCPSQIY